VYRVDKVFSSILILVASRYIMNIFVGDIVMSCIHIGYIDNYSGHYSVLEWSMVFKKNGNNPTTGEISFDRKFKKKNVSSLA